MTVTFTAPLAATAEGTHHAAAAAGNAAAATKASGVLSDALSGTAPVDRILLKAAAGAGKSYVLKRLVGDALAHPRCLRVAVVAFTNKQTHPLAISLGKALGRDRVCLRVSKAAFASVPDEVETYATIAGSSKDIPEYASVVISTVHMLGAQGELGRMESALGSKAANSDSVYDVLFVDEAWQIPHHLFDSVTRAAPIWVGVGDVGQLPPLEIGSNPWRGDERYNPYRAWPTDYDEDARTWAAELPAVWRPTASQLALWRAFYPEWGELNCVAGPGDRQISLGAMAQPAADVWHQVATGGPTLLEIDGLPPADAADVDVPLLDAVEVLLDELLEQGLTLRARRFDDDATPATMATPDEEYRSIELRERSDDPLIAVLATRNQLVDDAAEMVERLRAKHNLADTDLVSSTVDSYQGQTNGITIAIHPLTGAAKLDEFNSAFGRLAVTCTRATHGLLLVSRPGLDRLLNEAPARPGTPFGEPGNRTLPRQTHQRILATFARGTLDLTPTDA
ncbi:AAA family ATPase [Microbacterium flavum]|uniref:AAA family ATPase n=1 Tax=Microbacterium flavum TaxID=415216 RepID=A0ABS5XVS5_9MICO|nr:AAA family ATPase [Microbacterium flavum]MBT8798638.1 AAA family ATPase [Microbacterium flavum]